MKALLLAVLKTGTGTVGKLGFGILTTKIVAVMLGPSGIGLLSILRQISQLSVLVGTLNGGTAIVQGISSRSDEDKKAYIQTTFRIVLLMGFITCVVLLVAAPWMAEYILNSKSEEHIALMRWMTLPVMLGMMVLFLNSLLNGYREIGQLALVSVIGPLIMAILAWPISIMVQQGYPVAFVVMLACGALASLALVSFFLAKRNVLGWLFEPVNQDKAQACRQHFFSISLTMLLTGVMLLGTGLAIRALISHVFNIASVGIFDVAWTLSAMYVGIVTQSFGTYYLPTLSAIKENEPRLLLMGQIFRLVVLLMTPIIVAVIVIKPWLIHLLYAEAFLPSLDIIRWMLIGDYFKVSSFVLSFTMLAYRDMKTFFWSELLFLLILFIGSALAVTYWLTLEGIGISFTLMYACYFLFVYCYCVKKFNFVFNAMLLKTWLIGLLLIVVSSLSCWNAYTVDGLQLLWLPLTLLCSWLLLSPTERRKLLSLPHQFYSHRQRQKEKIRDDS